MCIQVCLLEIIVNLALEGPGAVNEEATLNWIETEGLMTSKMFALQYSSVRLRISRFGIVSVLDASEEVIGV